MVSGRTVADITERPEQLSFRAVADKEPRYAQEWQRPLLEPFPHETLSPSSRRGPLGYKGGEGLGG